MVEQLRNNWDYFLTNSIVASNVGIVEKKASVATTTTNERHPVQDLQTPVSHL
jgi:hypothetical protein